MTGSYREILDLIQQGFAENENLHNKAVYLNNAALMLGTQDKTCHEALLKNLLKSGKRMAGSQTLLLKSLLFYLSKSDALIKEIAQLLPRYQDDLEKYHYLLWKIRNSVFTFGGQLQTDTLPWIRETVIRPNYYQVLKVINECIFNEEASPAPRPQLKKVAIVLSQFLGDLHAPSRLALLIATGLTREYGLDVHIVNSNLLPVTRPLDYFYGFAPNISKDFVGKQNVCYEDNEFGTQYFTLRSFEAKVFDLDNLVNFWNVLEAEKFDAFINLGDVYFATDYFIERTPILCIPTLRDLPVTLADQVLLVHEALNQEEQAVIDCYYPKGAHVNFSFHVATDTVENKPTRSDFGLPEDAFLFVVVGNRLAFEMDRDFMAMVSSIVEADEKNYVLFVSEKLKINDILDRYGLPHSSQLKAVGFKNNLRRFLSGCDVYLNPRRSGGGVSGQIALAEHMPILTLNHGDVAALLPEQIHCSSYEAMQDLAIQLSHNFELLAQWRTSMAEVLQQRQTGKHNVDVIYQLLNDLHQDALARFQTGLPVNNPLQIVSHP